MSTSETNEVLLETEDRARVHRLTEEVQGRLEELAALGCRVLGLPLEAAAQRQFVRGQQATLDEAPYHHIEIVTTPTDPPRTVIVTYYDDGAIGIAYY